MIAIKETFAKIFRYFTGNLGAVMRTIQIHGVIFEEQGWYCIQCLEYDIAAQGESIDIVKRELDRVLRARVLVAREMGIDPFAGLKSAPKKFHDMYHQADRDEDAPIINDLVKELVAIQPTLRLLHRYPH